MGVRWGGPAWEKGEMGCARFFWMTPHASCPSESHERASWDGRRKRLRLARATGCPGKRRAPQAALILFGLPSLLALRCNRAGATGCPESGRTPQAARGSAALPSYSPPAGRRSFQTHQGLLHPKCVELQQGGLVPHIPNQGGQGEHQGLAHRDAVASK